MVIGGFSRGVIAFGGLAAGLVSFGGLSIGILVAIGGLAIGSLAFGGAAVGGAAIGGGAAGYYACGGGAAGEHVVDATHCDPEAQDFFRQYGLAGLCGAGQEIRGKDVRPGVAAQPVLFHPSIGVTVTSTFNSCPLPPTMTPLNGDTSP